MMDYTNTPPHLLTVNYLRNLASSLEQPESPYLSGYEPGIRSGLNKMFKLDHALPPPPRPQ